MNDNDKLDLLIITRKELKQEQLNAITGIFNSNTTPTIENVLTLQSKITSRFYQCIAIETSQCIDIKQWAPILGLAKNVYSEKVLFLYPNNAKTNNTTINTALRGLGFVEEATIPIDQEQYACASYNLNDYNRKRTWNNARFWANPENFHTHRW